MNNIIKIKSVLNEIVKDESHILAGRQGNIIKTLTRALEVAVDALEFYESEFDHVIAPENLNQIAEILEVKP